MNSYSKLLSVMNVTTYICNADDAGLFCMLPPNKMLGLKGDPCCSGENSRKRITVLLACNINGTDRPPPSLLLTHSLP